MFGSCLLALVASTIGPVIHPASPTSAPRRGSGRCRREALRPGVIARQGRAGVVRLHDVQRRLPATTQTLAGIKKTLEETKLWGTSVDFVSITLDPKRDTPEVLSRYARLFEADTAAWHFLTGSPAEVERAIAAWGMWAKIAPTRCPRPSVTGSSSSIPWAASARSTTSSFSRPSPSSQDVAALAEREDSPARGETYLATPSTDAFQQTA